MPDDNDDTPIKKAANTSNTAIILQLGDIVTLSSPSNEVFDKQTFIIDFINPSKIVLINTSTMDMSTIRVNTDGVLGDGTITNIDLVYRNKHPGYAKQNNLLPGTWITIHFGGDIPATITGQITNLEEDMVEIKTYPDDENIYINFDYSGIPEELPIELIEIREKPASMRSSKEKEEEENTADAFVGEADPQPISDGDDDANVSGDIVDVGIDDVANDEGVQDDIGDDELYSSEPGTGVPKQAIQEHLHRMMLEADDVIFGLGEELAPIDQYVEKRDANIKYSIEAQCNDLLDEMLSTIPSTERTRSVLKNIHTMIERFKQLRVLFSTLDNNGNVVAPLRKGATWKPLVDELTHFNHKLYWLLPVVTNIKKVYNVSGELEDLPSDITTLSTNEDIANIQKEMDLFKSNNFPDGQNKYNYLIKRLDAESTPFQEFNPEQSSSIIHTSKIGSNLNTIVNNLGLMYSSVVSNSALTTRKYVTQMYNLGTKTIVSSKLNKKEMKYTLTNLTEPDEMSINSLLTLQEPVVRFSRINLPTTNILDRSNLNQSFLNYWQLLNSVSRVKTIQVNSASDIFNEEDFLKYGVQYVMDKQQGSGVTTEEAYRNFLDKVVPTIKTLFRLTTKYLQGKMSLVDAIKQMEPFLVYTDDLTFMQYQFITDFINKEIAKRLKLFVERSHMFSKLRSIQTTTSFNPSAQSLYDATKKLSGEVFTRGYNYTKTNMVSNSELLHRVLQRDCGRLYNSAVAFENIHLMFPENMSQLFEDTSVANKGLLNEYAKDNDCKKYVLAKQYTSTEELETDNNREVYYDKAYDTTNYSLMDNYVADMSTKDPDEFIEFMVKKLEKTQKLSTDDAMYLADTLVNNMKKVREGDYAFIFDIQNAESSDDQGNLTYYERKNNVWVVDKSIDKSVFVTDDNLLCNLQPNCVQTESKCEPTNLTKSELESRALKNIMSEFDEKYATSKERMEGQIKLQFEYNNSTIEKLARVQSNDVFLYNTQQVKIGSNNAEQISDVVSPFYAGLQTIIGQGDFIKKQDDIVRFATQFTRKALPDTSESIHWRYCIKTNTPLLPEFRYTLAASFINSPDQYIATIEHLKGTIGRISDDGNAWVDVHSGQVIVYDNFVDEDTYVDGFKDISHAILEKDAAQNTLASIQTTKKQTHEMKMCSNIVDSFATNMGINIEDHREFIVDTALRVFYQLLPSESDYTIQIKEASKNNVSLPSYNEVYNTLLLYNVMASFLISVQTSIPSITTKRTFPGCIASFKGFPFEGAGDDSAINYISCLAYNIRNSTEPWKVLMKKKQTFIATKLKTNIQKNFVNHPDIIRKFNEKAEYLLTTPELDIPTELSMEMAWKNFLPPLVPFKITNLHPLTTEFKDRLLQDLKSGYSRQREDLAVVASKIIFYSLALQQRIQGVVSKHSPILKNAANDPFMENACCDERNDHISTIQYFINNDKEIDIYNQMVGKLSLIIEDVTMITRGGLFYSPLNTKTLYPPLKPDFSEETIYQAFVVYCRFNSILPVPEFLSKFCEEKPRNIQPNASLREMIKKLKDDDRNYTYSSVIQLFQVVSRENIVNTSFAVPATDYVQGMRYVLEDANESASHPTDNLDDEEEYEFDDTFRRLLSEKLDAFDVIKSGQDDNLRAFKNFLFKENASMRTRMVDFVSQYTTLKMNKDSITSMLSNLFSFEEDQEYLPPGISDTEGYNFIQAIRTFVANIVNVYPNIILNKVDYTNNAIPSYWKLSHTHSIDIHNIIKNDVHSLRKFYSNPTLVTLLTTIQPVCKRLVKLMNTTPYFTKIEFNEQHEESVFDQRTSILLAEYYMMSAVTRYIELTDEAKMLYVEETQTEVLEEVFTIESLDDENTRANVVVQNQDFDLLLEGNKKRLKVDVADLLATYMQIMNKTIQKTINVSYESIMNDVYLLKEGEKHEITGKLASMTDEERNVNNMLKANKLGDWGKGLQKGLLAYDKDVYDEEREMMNRIAMTQTALYKNPEVSDRNIDQYMADYTDEERTNEYIENDEYDMSHMSEEYDDGNYGGDELEDEYTE